MKLCLRGEQRGLHGHDARATLLIKLCLRGERLGAIEYVFEAYRSISQQGQGGFV